MIDAMEYLKLVGVSAGAVILLLAIYAGFQAKGNPALAFSIFITLLKKYWALALVLVAGIFTTLLYTASKRSVGQAVDDQTTRDVATDKLKTQILDIQTKAAVDMAVAKTKDITLARKLEAVKRLPPKDRRKRLAELLVVVLMVFSIAATAGYISALPKQLGVSAFIGQAPEFEVGVADGCSFEKIVVDGGMLTTADGSKYRIPGGILISDCKAEQLIKYQSAAKRFYVERNQLATVYDATYQGCSAMVRRRCLQGIPLLRPR